VHLLRITFWVSVGHVTQLIAIVREQIEAVVILTVRMYASTILGSGQFDVGSVALTKVDDQIAARVLVFEFLRTAAVIRHDSNSG
jgi:hypothetical protein